MSESSTYQRPASPTASTSEESTITSNSESSRSENGDKDKNEALIAKMKFFQNLKCLPWLPKVRMCELETFLDQERKKFLGYGDLSQDLDTLIGLPNPIHESIRTLRQHLYVSLAEEQIKLEEKFLKYPLSTKEACISNEENEDTKTPTEVLFSALLTNLPQYLVFIFYYYSHINILN